jgi:hypothetical protein
MDRIDSEGDSILVDVFRPFWPEADNYTETVHSLIVYADLLVTADPRNLGYRPYAGKYSI